MAVENAQNDQLFIADGKDDDAILIREASSARLKLVAWCARQTIRGKHPDFCVDIKNQAVRSNRVEMGEVDVIFEEIGTCRGGPNGVARLNGQSPFANRVPLPTDECLLRALHWKRSDAPAPPLHHPNPPG